MIRIKTLDWYQKLMSGSEQNFDFSEKRPRHKILFCLSFLLSFHSFYYFFPDATCSSARSIVPFTTFLISVHQISRCCWSGFGAILVFWGIPFHPTFCSGTFVCTVFREIALALYSPVLLRRRGARRDTDQCCEDRGEQSREGEPKFFESIQWYKWTVTYPTYKYPLITYESSVTIWTAYCKIMDHLR
jgi:hypothetical protein